MDKAFMANLVLGFILFIVAMDIVFRIRDRFSLARPKAVIKEKTEEIITAASVPLEEEGGTIIKEEV